MRVADRAERGDIGHGPSVPRRPRLDCLRDQHRRARRGRTVEGVYAVGRKERRRTKAGAPYLALELVDASGRIEARVWDDVELLDSRFAEGDAVRVLGRVERFGGRLQVQVRAVEVAAESDPAELTPTMRRDADELDGFLDFLAAEIATRGSPRVVAGILGDDGSGSVSGASRRRRGRSPRLRRRAPRAHGRRRDAVPRDGAAASAPAQRHPRSPPRSCTMSGARVELGRGPAFRQTEEGRLLGHVHLGVRLIEERAASLDTGARAELLHAVAVHHDRQAARTAEAAVLYHANQLDAQAATRPVGERGAALVDSGRAGARRGGALGHGRLLRRPRDPAVNVLIVLFWSQLAGLAGRRGLDRRRAARAAGSGLLYAAAAGIAGAVGLGCLYRGMAIGAMGIVAPDLGHLAHRAARLLRRAGRLARGGAVGRHRCSRSRESCSSPGSRAASAQAGGGGRRPRARRGARVRAVRRRARGGGPGERLLGRGLLRGSAPSPSSCSRSPGRGTVPRVPRRLIPLILAVGAVRHRRERADRGRDDPRLDRDRGGAQRAVSDHDDPARPRRPARATRPDAHGRWVDRAAVARP